MKAKLINIVDINNPELNLYGVKILGFRRPVFGFDNNGIISNTDKNKVKEWVAKFNIYLKENPQLKEQIYPNKDVHGIKLSSQIQTITKWTFKNNYQKILQFIIQKLYP